MADYHKTTSDTLTELVGFSAQQRIVMKTVIKTELLLYLWGNLLQISTGGQRQDKGKKKDALEAIGTMYFHVKK